MIAPFFLAPWRPTLSSYALQFWVGASTYVATIDLVAGRDYWASCDGRVDVGNQDLVTILCEALETASGVAFSCALVDGHVTITGASAVAYQIDWDVGASTLPPEPFGFWRQRFFDSAYTFTAAFTPLGAWRPERVFAFDSDDVPEFQSSIVTTVGGQSRGYYLGEATTRELRFESVPRAKILARYAAEPLEGGNGSFQAVVEAMRIWCDGRPLRYYEDEGADAWDLYTFAPDAMPEKTASRDPRYNVTIKLRSYVTTFSSEASFDFHGVAFYLCQYNAGTLGGSTQATISFWVRPEALATSTLLSRSKGSGSYGWTVETDSSGHLIVRIAKSTSDITTYWTSAAGVLALANWAHVAIVFVGTASGTAKLKVYVDGADVTSAGTFSGTWTQGSIPNPSSTPLVFGSDWTYGADFDGQLDEVATWSTYAASATDVAEIFNAGVPRDLRTLNAAPSPSHYWRGENNSLDEMTSSALYGHPRGFAGAAYV